MNWNGFQDQINLWGSFGGNVVEMGFSKALISSLILVWLSPSLAATGKVINNITPVHCGYSLHQPSNKCKLPVLIDTYHLQRYSLFSVTLG